MNNKTIQKKTVELCIAAVFMAMNIGLSSFGVPVPGGHLYLNDIVICTAAIILEPFYAFAVGGIGAFLGDFFFYPTPMFVSLITHGLQAIVISVFSHYVMKDHEKLSSCIGVAIGAVIMVVGYTIGRAYIYGTPVDAVAKLPFQILQATLGAVLGMVISYALGIKKLVNSKIK